MISVNQSLALSPFYFTRILKRSDHLLTECINCKIKRNLIYFTHLDGIDEKASIDTHKSVQQPIHQSTSSDGGSGELYDYPI